MIFTALITLFLICNIFIYDYKHDIDYLGGKENE